MTSIAERQRRIRQLLSQLGTAQRIRRTGLASKLFELECFFYTAVQLAQRNKTPHSEQLSNGIFRPLLNPGRLGNGSYLRFTDNVAPTAERTELFLNSQVSKRTPVPHCPDIILTVGNRRDLCSVYECKDYSGRLGIEVYREFIGLLIELGLVRMNNRGANMVDRILPNLSPKIYTTAIKLASHCPLEETYGFLVEDGMT